MPPLVVSESHRAHILYCSHSDLHSDKERESDENTDDTGDEGTRGSVYDERVVEARGDTQETEIPPDANTEVSRLSSTRMWTWHHQRVATKRSEYKGRH